MPAARPQSASAPPIADNSFLIEEAYNQEYGVVQHITAFQRGFQTEDWEYSFTQEWPFNPAPKTQLSYTLLSLSSGVPGAGGGIGDTLLNYRYQAVSGERTAFAPRASLLLPSGSSRRGRGAGGMGMEFNLPLSVQVAEKLVTHWNAGATIVPRTKNPLGETATTYGYFLGASFIHQTHPRFNLMLETLFDSSQSVVAQDRAAFESSMIVNPGFRWAHNFESGLQIVPGIAFPVEVARAGRGNWGIFLYLSFEHPFGRRAP
ncbi:MAG: transporter [Candidatus Acidiferrales bacterium]